MKCIASHSEATLWEVIVHSLWGAMADLVQYLGLHAPVSQMIEKLKLVYCVIACFDVLDRIFIGCNMQEWKG